MRQLPGGARVHRLGAPGSLFGGLPAVVAPNFDQIVADMPWSHIWDFRTGSLAPVYGTGTFVATRASQKWVRGSNGLLGLIANDAAPFNYSSVDGVRRILPEDAGTQLLVAASSRDLTNVNWVKVNGTATKDQSGADGVAAAASSFLATAPNATCLQTVVAAATNRVLSMRVKRLVGTGTVTITGDNFSTSTDITALINANTYTRVFLNPASVLNPVVGIKLANSGDKVAVDFVNLVAATQLTSDLDATVSSRVADVVVLNPFSLVTPCTIVVSGMMQAIDGTLDATARQMFTISDGTALERYTVQRTASLQSVSPVIVDGGVSQISGVSKNVGPNVRVVCAMGIETNNFVSAINASAEQTDATVTLPTVNRIHLGTNYNASGSWWDAGIETIHIAPQRLPNKWIRSLAGG